MRYLFGVTIDAFVQEETPSPPGREGRLGSERLSANCPRDPHISEHLNVSQAMTLAAVP